MKIKVRRIKEEDIPKLIKFNRRMYRNRDKIEDSISFRILKNPFSKQIFSKQNT